MLKRMVSVLVVSVAIALFALPLPSWAVDLTKGAQVFSANCAACHAGGGNLVNTVKTLKKEDLEKYGMASLDAIITQINNGKAGMPAFKGRLTNEQIEDVANYVLSQADKGWS